MKPGEPLNPPPLKTLLAPDQPVPRKDTTRSRWLVMERAGTMTWAPARGARRFSRRYRAEIGDCTRPLAVVVPAPHMEAYVAIKLIIRWL